MNDFARALQQAWRHWPALTLALLCSLGVAVLWGANIAAIFPIIETTLHGESLQTWNQKRLEKAEQSLAAHQAEIQKLDERRSSASEPAVERELGFRLDMLQTQIKVDRAGVYSAQRLQPFFSRFLPSKPFATVTLIALLVAVATALKQFLMLSNTMLVSYVSQSIARDVRGRIFDKALSLDRPAFDLQGISGFTAHITHTTDMLATGITNFYGGAVTEPLRIVACLGGAWVISWRLTLASLIFAPLAAFLILFLNRRIRALSLSILDRSMGFHHVMLEVFNSLLSVQANTMEDFERERFRESTKNIRRIALKATFYNALSSPVTELLGMGMLCTGVIVSGYLVINQETHIFGIPMSDKPLSITLVTVFFAMLIGASDPLRKLSSVISGVNSGMAAAGLLYPILEMKPYLVESTSPKPLPSPHGRIEFRDIHFTYDGIQKVIENVNLTITRGDHLAIVGPNGGGKSTLINLLCRFYDPQQGQVLIDGVSLRDVALKDLRSRIALVTQQTELFNETILHNIRYGRWDATEAEVTAAARLARADAFISAFPQGYQTIVGPNGQRLSGGQRQRIALARAFLRNAEILVLDEATSQIDVESEKLIHEALAEFGQNRTLVMITHRESTLSLATRIVRVEHGRLQHMPIALKVA
ncbi:MAG: ABC transporter ATP-binding protein/permease [Planctomycetes bacterium]|nr:ABC transporter ATP-binding protein/permease [Planctomycetota bacterium]